MNTIQRIIAEEEAAEDAELAKAILAYAQKSPTLKRQLSDSTHLAAVFTDYGRFIFETGIEYGHKRALAELAKKGTTL